MQSTTSKVEPLESGTRVSPSTDTSSCNSLVDMVEGCSSANIGDLLLALPKVTINFGHYMHTEVLTLGRATSVVDTTFLHRKRQLAVLL